MLDITNKMILIPSGNEIMRNFYDEHKWISSNSKMSIPGSKGDFKEVKQEIEIKPFFISAFLVTTDLYHHIVDKKTSTLSNDLPVVNVSWYDAVNFCNLLSIDMGFDPCYDIDIHSGEVFCNWGNNGFRLPSEAEWQYACRAGSKDYQYGEIEDIAWYSGNSDGHIHKVGERAPNQWGIYDMLGNVWEWCWDLYDEKHYGSYRVFRGGSWAEEQRCCGATCRRRSHPSFQIDDLGFRIAKSI